jgi:hypothetical protein
MLAQSDAGSVVFKSRGKNTGNIGGIDKLVTATTMETKDKVTALIRDGCLGFDRDWETDGYDHH